MSIIKSNGEDIMNLSAKKTPRGLISTLILLLASACTSLATAATVASKTVTVYNDSDRTIFIVIQTSMNPVDEWLQGVYATRTANLKTETYGHTKLYRLYVNGVNGIAPGSFAKVKLPFYTKLAENPVATTPDQYIDWWNGGRVAIFDNKDDVTKFFNADQNNAVGKTYSVLPTCAGGACTSVSIFYNTADPPHGNNTRSQLSEYTFGSVLKGPKAYKMFYGNVDYDISYVDHIYMPIAMQPDGNRYIGYTGSIKTFKETRNIISKFIAPGAIGDGWPYYLLDNNPGDVDKKLPGTHDAIALIPGQDITTPGKSIDTIKALWKQCLDPADCKTFDPNMNLVKQLFTANFQKYQNQYSGCSPRVPNPNTPEELVKEMLKHIYGWVPFNEGCNDADTNAIKYMPGAQAVQVVYTDVLQKNETGQAKPGFNPFVTLIHSKDYMDMNAYAFSVDDAVGNMLELGDGIVLSVGGKGGLPNPLPFTPTESVIVTLGAPANWVTYGACNPIVSPCKTDMKIPPGGLAFKIGTLTFPYAVAIEDKSGNHYAFNINTKPPLTAASISNCTVNQKSSPWCSGIIVPDPKTHGGLNYINLSPGV